MSATEVSSGPDQAAHDAFNAQMAAARAAETQYANGTPPQAEFLPDAAGLIDRRVHEQRAQEQLEIDNAWALHEATGLAGTGEVIGRDTVEDVGRVAAESTVMEPEGLVGGSTPEAEATQSPQALLSDDETKALRRLIRTRNGDLGDQLVPRNWSDTAEQHAAKKAAAVAEAKHEARERLKQDAERKAAEAATAAEQAANEQREQRRLRSEEKARIAREQAAEAKKVI